MMLRLNVIRYFACILQLTERFLTIADGKSLDPVPADLLGQRRHGARIEASTKEHAERNIAHQVRRNGLFEQLAVSLDVVLAGTRYFIHLGCEIPILRDLRLTAFGQLQSMSGHKFPDARKHCFRPRDVAESQVFGKRASVELGRNPRIGENRLDLRTKQKRSAIPTVVKRLDAETIASRKQNALAAIPNGESKHTPQVLHAIAAIFLIEVNNCFRVAASAVAVAFGLETGAQLSVVVDFAVVDNPDVLVFIGKRLVAGLHVNNAQPPHRQTDILLDKKTFIVGAPVHDALVHAGEQVALDMPLPIGEKNAADSTHIN